MTLILMKLLSFAIGYCLGVWIVETFIKPRIKK